MKDTVTRLLALPAEERLRLAHLLWESTAGLVADEPLTDTEKRMLDERLDDSDSEARETSSWPEARERILSSIRTKQKP